MLLDLEMFTRHGLLGLQPLTILHVIPSEEDHSLGMIFTAEGSAVADLAKVWGDNTELQIPRRAK